MAGRSPSAAEGLEASSAANVQRGTDRESASRQVSRSFARRSIGFGILMWLVPFLVAFAVFPFRESARPLFESVMAVAVTSSAVVLGLRYFRSVEVDLVREGAAVGLVWLGLSILIDAPLMLLGGPMQMTLAEYMADIGLTYALIPVVTTGLGVAQAGAVRATSRSADDGSA